MVRFVESASLRLANQWPSFFFNAGRLPGIGHAICFLFIFNKTSFLFFFYCFAFRDDPESKRSSSSINSIRCFSCSLAFFLDWRKEGFCCFQQKKNKQKKLSVHLSCCGEGAESGAGGWSLSGERLSLVLDGQFRWVLRSWTSYGTVDEYFRPVVGPPKPAVAAQPRQTSDPSHNNNSLKKKNPKKNSQKQPQTQTKKKKKKKKNDLQLCLQKKSKAKEKKKGPIRCRWKRWPRSWTRWPAATRWRRWRRRAASSTSTTRRRWSPRSAPSSASSSSARCCGSPSRRRWSAASASAAATAPTTTAATTAPTTTTSATLAPPVRSTFFFCFVLFCFVFFLPPISFLIAFHDPVWSWRVLVALPYEDRPGGGCFCFFGSYLVFT